MHSKAPNNTLLNRIGCICAFFFLGFLINVNAQTHPGTGDGTNCSSCAPPGWTLDAGSTDVSNVADGWGTFGAWPTPPPPVPNGEPTWLTAHTDEVASMTISELVVGRSYTLLFYYMSTEGPDVGGGFGPTFGYDESPAPVIRYQVDGGPVVSRPIPVDGVWYSEPVTFTATGTEAPFVFLGGDGDNFGSLTNISFAPNSVVSSCNPTIGNDTTVCQNLGEPDVTFLFSGLGSTPPYTFTYNIDGGPDQTVSTAGTDTTVVITAPTDQQGTFVYNLTAIADAGGPLCTDLTATATIIISAPPTASVASDVTVCLGDPAPTVTFTGTGTTGPYDIDYTIDNGAVQTVTTGAGATATGTVTAPTGGAGVFTYDIVNVQDGTTCGQAQTGSVDVSVSALSGTVTGTATIPQNNPQPDVTFTGANGTAPYIFTYTVNGGGNQTVTSDGAGVVTVGQATDVVGDFVYDLVSVEDASGLSCVSVDAATISITDEPYATIAADVTVCQGAGDQIITFTGGGSTGPYTINYTLDGAAQTAVTTAGPGDDFALTVTVGPVGTYTYALVDVSDATRTIVANGTAVITVTNPPTATISGDASRCLNDPIPNVIFVGADGAGGPYTIEYTINGGATQTVVTDGAGNASVAAQTAAGGVFTYDLVSVADVNCSQAAVGSTVITVDPLNGALSGATSVCLNSASPNVTFTGNNGAAPYTFTYQEDGGGDLTVTSDGTGIVTVPVPTNALNDIVYTLSNVSDNGGSSCASTSTVTITRESPPTATAGGTTTICQNSPTTVSGTNAQFGTILWTHDGAGNLTGATTLTPTYTSSAGDAGNVVTLTITVTSTNSCAPQTATATETINVDPLPTAVTTGSATICEDATYTLANGEATATGGTVNWTVVSGSGTLTNQTTLTPSYAAAAGDAGTTVNLLMTVTSNNACTGEIATANYGIVVDPLPTATAGGLGAMCQGGSYTLPNGVATAANGTIDWVPGIGGTGNVTAGAAGLTPTYTPSPTITGNSFITMNVSSNNACAGATAQASYNIDIDRLPTATVGGPNSICEDGSYQLTGGEAALTDGTPSWTHNGAGSITGENTLTPTYTAAGGDAENTVTLTMTVLSNNGCAGSTVTDTYDISVDPLPIATSGIEQTICADGRPGTVSGAIAIGGTISWSHNGSGTLSNTGTASPTYTAVLADAGNPITLTMTVNSVGTCAGSSVSASTIVNVRALLTASIDLSVDDDRACIDDDVDVFLTGAGGDAPYNFTYTEKGVGKPISSSISPSPTALAPAFTDEEGEVVYTITGITDAHNCPVRIVNESITLTVDPLPSGFVTKDTSYCVGDNDEFKPLVMTGTGGAAPYSFNYSINNEFAPSNDSLVDIWEVPLSISDERPEEYIFRLDSVTDNNGCTGYPKINNDKDTVQIIINATPTARFSVDPDRTTVLEPTIGIFDASDAEDDSRWEWYFKDGSPIGTEQDFFEHTYKDTGTYEIELVVTTGYCVHRTSQTVIVEIPLLMYIPQAFTPNGDGINDTFSPKGDGFDDYSMRIYDRWGNMIFFTDDINKGWDGAANGGSEMAQIDAYIYVVDVVDTKTQQSYTYRGVLSMMR